MESESESEDSGRYQEPSRIHTNARRAESPMRGTTSAVSSRTGSASSITATKADGETPHQRRSTVNTVKFGFALTEDTGKALIEAVLDGERFFPLDRESFFAFLQEERALELGHFYVDARAHRKLAAASQVNEAKTKAEFVAAHYILDDAEEAINIGAADKQRIFDRIAHEAADPLLFDPAVKETLQMLKGGAFSRFLDRNMQTNITDAEAYVRYRKAAAWYALAAAVFVLFVSLQVSLPGTVVGNRWWRVLCFFPLLPAIMFSLSASCRICTDLALRRTKMRPGDDYTKVDSWKDTDGRKVVDDLAAATLRRLGLAVYWKGLLWAAFATVLIVALPPGYGT